MVPAVIATLIIAGLDPENLPGGLTEVPFAPPLPIVMMVMSLVALIVVGGKFSVDKMMTGAKSTAPEAG